MQDGANEKESSRDMRELMRCASEIKGAGESRQKTGKEERQPENPKRSKKAEERKGKEKRK